MNRRDRTSDTPTLPSEPQSPSFDMMRLSLLARMLVPGLEFAAPAWQDPTVAARRREWMRAGERVQL